MRRSDTPPVPWPLAKHDTVHGIPVDILAVQPDKLTDTHTGAVQQLNEGQIPLPFAGAAQDFPLFVTVRLLTFFS